MAEPYEGYAPSNVARDAKYSIRHDPDDGEMKVHLLYRVGHRERALLSTDLHLKLVRMVNAVKVEVQGTEGGIFYINEWGHVLVKSADRQCYYAGLSPDDDPPLTFMFDGHEVSSAPSGRVEAGRSVAGPPRGDQVHDHRQSSRTSSTSTSFSRVERSSTSFPRSPTAQQATSRLSRGGSPI